MDSMQVLVTEASSPVAYHLLYLLANGDIIQQRKLNIVLCDGEEKKSALEGVRYELQDSVFEHVVSISISCNFCEVFRTADLAIILPLSTPRHHGYSEVEVTHSLLQERDFQCLEGAVQKLIRRKDSVFIQSRGPMSKAHAIGNYIREAYQDSIKVVKLPKEESPSFPQLSCVQIYGTEGHDLYDELVLSKMHPVTMNQQANGLGKVNSSSKSSFNEQLYERLQPSELTDQVLLVYALEHHVDEETYMYDKTKRDETELWSRL